VHEDQALTVFLWLAAFVLAGVFYVAVLLVSDRAGKILITWRHKWRRMYQQSLYQGTDFSRAVRGPLMSHGLKPCPGVCTFGLRRNIG
jgi:hypothetical protein